MRIDSHQHFWKYNAQDYGWIDSSMAVLRRDFLPHDLDAELKKLKFDGSVAVQARQSLEETRWLLRLADETAFILGVVGWVDLCSVEIAAHLESLAGNPKLVGVRHVVQSEPDEQFLLRPDFLRGIAALEEFNLAYDILIYPRQLRVAAEFVERFPRQRFVLDHAAKPSIAQSPIKSGGDQWEQGFRRLAAFPNVFCKLSGMVTEADWQNWIPEDLRPYLDVAFDSFGPERLMTGSDWPVCLVAGSYSRVMKVIEEYVDANCPQMKHAVLGGNAQKFWRLKS